MTYEMCWPQVPHPAQQVEGAVPHGDEGLVAEEDGLAAVRGLGELGEHDAGHAGLDEDAEHALHAHHHDGGGALGGGGAAPVAAQSPLLVTIPIHRTLPLHYPMVCCVSTLNRKAEVKSTTLSTQTTCSDETLTSKSPEISASDYFEGRSNVVTMQEPNEVPDHSE